MCVFSWFKKASRNETQKCQSIARKSFKVKSKWILQFGEKMLFNISARFMFIIEHQKQIWFLWFYWWWCIRVVEIFRASCWRVSWDAEKYYKNFYGLLHENLLPQKCEGDITVTSWYLVIWNCKSSFDTLYKFRRGHRW